MKRLIWYASLLLLFYVTNTITIEAQKNKIATTSLYAHYFLIKESIKAYIHSYIYDTKIIEQAIIACNTCNYTMTSGYLWGYCASSCDEQTLQKLMPLIHKGSIEELTHFLVTSYEKLHIACPTCHQYQGWHIPKIN